MTGLDDRRSDEPLTRTGTLRAQTLAPPARTQAVRGRMQDANGAWMAYNGEGSAVLSMARVPVPSESGSAVLLVPAIDCLAKSIRADTLL